MLSDGLSDFSGVSLSDRPGNWSSQASWRGKQSEHKVVGHCGTVFGSLQNIPEKSELQSHIFKLEKAVQQIYTLRAEGNAKVFQTCSQVVSELETACTPDSVSEDDAMHSRDARNNPGSHGCSARCALTHSPRLDLE